jgi:acetyl/propionyl-CoA carboxylase alpha subunit
MEKLTVALHLMLDGEQHEIEIVRRRPHLRLRVDGREYEICEREQGTAGCMMIDGESVTFSRAIVPGQRETCFVRLEGRTLEIDLVDPREETAGRDLNRDEVHAPMPGAVISVHKVAGEAVARGETIVTIESMKLQTALTAPRDGHLLEILKAAGEKFDKDELLVRLVPEGGE